MRFYDIQRGEILIDDINIKDMTRENLRSHLAMVLQHTWLFNGTIRENIRYGRQDASDEEVVRAADMAYADHFIRTLPGGYDMALNEDATNVSAGQKQLLTIAQRFWRIQHPHPGRGDQLGGHPHRGAHPESDG